MGFLSLAKQWHDNITQIEKGDLVIGGSNGIANKQAQQLAENLLFLKDILDFLGIKKDNFSLSSDVILTPNRSQTEKNKDLVSVFDFFTKEEYQNYQANSDIDVTRPLQAALDSGKNIDLVGKTFYACNLIQTTNLQCLVSSQGIARIVKNSDGDILTSNANYGFYTSNIIYAGEKLDTAFSGNGLVIYGNNPTIFNCGSRWIKGRPLKALGNRVVIKGCCDIYQTTDATTNGYDIEIGNSGTSTLYHHIEDIYTSQKQGGILLIDTGSHTIVGGQYYKLTIKAGTKPAGVNGGKTIGSRILGDILVEQSNATFVSNQIDPVNITFALGTSFCSFDASNILANGAVITNNGNLNNFIERNIATGADGTFKIAYGPDNYQRTISMALSDATKAYQFDGSVVVPNLQGYRTYAKDLTTIHKLLSLTSTDQVEIGAMTGQYSNLLGTNISITTSGGTQIRVSDGFIAPYTDNTKNLGTPSLRWANVYAATSAINTSDERLKTNWQSIEENEKQAASQIKNIIKKYQFTDSVEIKGDKARYHFGIGAQTVEKILRDNSLDPNNYGFFCHDTWESQEAVLDDDGNTIQPEIKPGDRYGIRYDELILFILASS